MKVITFKNMKNVSGGIDHGELAAGAIGQFVGGTLGAEFGPVGVRIGQAAGGLVGKEVYGGIRDGYQTAPGVKQGLGSFNPNYSGRPMLCNPPAQILGCPHY